MVSLNFSTARPPFVSFTSSRRSSRCPGDRQKNYERLEARCYTLSMSYEPGYSIVRLGWNHCYLWNNQNSDIFSDDPDPRTHDIWQLYLD